MRKTYKYKVMITVRNKQRKIIDEIETRFIFSNCDEAYDFIMKDISSRLTNGITGMKMMFSKEETKIKIARFGIGIYVGEIWYFHGLKTVEYYIRRDKLERIEV